METWEQLLKRQHGLFTLAQAGAHGVPTPLLRQRERDGLYRTVAPKTMYVAGSVELPPRAQLWRAVLTLDHAALSHTTAAILWQLRVADDDAVHVTVPRGGWRPRTGFQLHTSRSMSALDRGIRCDLPVTSLERSLVDTFDLLEVADARKTLVADAFRSRVTTLAKVSDCVLRLAQLHRRAELFECLELAAGGSHSAGEMKLLAFLTRWSFPTPARQLVPELRYGRRYVDCAFPAYQIALEYDGRHHLDDAQRHDDQLRDEALRRLRWVTIRISGRRLRDERRLAGDIRANLVEQAERFGLEPPPAPIRRA